MPNCAYSGSDARGTVLFILIEDALTVEVLAAMMHGYGQWNDSKLMKSE
jgi:hypothetical protein